MRQGSFEKAKVLDNLRRQCSRREYCTSDIRKKITDAYSKASAADCTLEDALSSIIGSLTEDKYLSDARYAAAFARDKASLSGWGEVKIRYMLSAKGISKETISEALTQVDEDGAAGRLERLLEAKYRTLREDPQCKLKMLRYALGRGYSYDEVSGIVERLVRGE